MKDNATTAQHRRLLLVLNPGAHGGRGRRRWAIWQERLAAARCDVVTRETAHLDDAIAYAHEARNMDAVVACGGDGTINRVLHGLMLRPAQTRPALGVLYAGTSPDFCRWHGIPTDPRDAVHALLQREPRTVDVMQITYRDATGGERVGYFGCSANLGIGARVAARANRWRPWLGDTLGTALAVVSTLAGRFPTLTVACNNGAPVTLPRCCNLTIAKNPELASGLRLGLPIAPDDGQAAVVGIHSRGPGRLLRLLPALYRGRIAEATGIFIATARDVHVTSSGFCPVEFDGDPQGQLPATLQVIPRAIHLLGTTHPGMSG